MKKLIKFLKKLDQAIFPISFGIFVFLIPLYPKFPLIPLNFTYIAIRFEDLYFVFLTLLFFIQLLRRKYTIDLYVFKWFVFFWIAIFISYFAGVYLYKTIEYPKIGLLHTLRRVEYMLPFFYAAAVIKNRKSFLYWLKLFLIALLLVNLYALGQKYFGFPAVQTMNPEYAKGRILRLTPEARVSSTFAGHYDLAAYLVIFIPVIIGLYFYSKQRRYLILLILSIYTLILTVSRISFIAYLVSSITLLLLLRRFRFLIFLLLITFSLSFVFNKELIDRFARTFQVKKVLVNKQTGEIYIPQEMRPDELPAGSFGIKINKNPLLEKIAEEQTSQKDLLEAEKKALKDIAIKAGLSTQEAVVIAEKRDYKALEEKLKNNSALLEQLEKLQPLVSNKQVNERQELARKYLEPATTILSDISFATRLQIEWPRAIAAFISSPLVGFGASALTEATDNDYLRWLGEFGLLGTTIFLYILIRIFFLRFIYRAKQLAKKNNPLHFIFAGISAGFFALLINAAYIDVFEASKVAFTFWMIMGIFYSFDKILEFKLSENKK